MSFPVTDVQLAALLGNHDMFFQASVIRGNQALGDIEVIDARVYATYGTQGGRDAQITVDRNIIDTGLLNPLSDQVILRTGIKGVVQIPIFTGRVDTIESDSSGQVNVPLLSRGAEAIRAAFESPWAAMNGNTARAEIRRILQDVDVAWGVDFSNANSELIPSGLVWEEDRGQALDQLAQGASLIWQPDRTGGFVVYTNPYSIGPSLGANPVVTLRDGENGTTVKVIDTVSRDGIYNSVTVVTERVNNTAPIRVTVRDGGAASPTRWGGIFGKQNVVYKNQVPVDLATSIALARRFLRQSLALQRSWQITTPHLPILDPGDVFALWYRDEVTAQVVETVEYGMSAEQPTIISSRELRLTETIEEIL